MVKRKGFDKQKYKQIFKGKNKMYTNIGLHVYETFHITTKLFAKQFKKDTHFDQLTDKEFTVLVFALHDDEKTRRSRLVVLNQNDWSRIIRTEQFAVFMILSKFQDEVKGILIQRSQYAKYYVSEELYLNRYTNFLKRLVHPTHGARYVRCDARTTIVAEMKHRYIYETLYFQSLAVPFFSKQ